MDIENSLSVLARDTTYSIFMLKAVIQLMLKAEFSHQGCYAIVLYKRSSVTITKAKNFCYVSTTKILNNNYFIVLLCAVYLKTYKCALYLPSQKAQTIVN